MFKKGDMVEAINTVGGEEIYGEVVEVRKDMLVVMDEYNIYKLPFKFNEIKKSDKQLEII